MKIVESWLREWVDPSIDTEALGHQLTMGGHEVNDIEIQGADLKGVVVAEVVEVSKHPDADRLTVCKVSTGSKKNVTVVCGAPNVVKGMKSPLAASGLTLPNGVKLKKAKIRGVESNGMLCSAIELGLGDESDGIIALPDDAPVGTELAKYLKLPDAVFDLDLTPNRGDCFSVLGIARDVAAITDTEIKAATVTPVPASIDDVQPVELVQPDGCPRFAGRVIRGIDPNARSPLWMVEKLRRSDLRPIHPVVDITNIVMLELGQPLHAYDQALLKGPIRPRLAKQGEKVTLLDESEIEANADTLVISDDTGAIGLAGIMGGLSTAVSEGTTDVFFEAAFWPQDFIAGRARAYGMHTDASLRFERGVDPEGQARAVERATELLLQISGGQAGPLVVTESPDHLPSRSPIKLRRDRLALLLGMSLESSTVTNILTRLNLGVDEQDDGWEVSAPSYRFDISVEVDLIEEVARIFGYDNVPESTAIAATPLEAVTESLVDFERVATTLVARDYQEVITYSFIDAGSDQQFSGIDSQLRLSNPISSEMSVMRASLWPGMVEAAAANAARQQDRIRIFEIGKSFHGALDAHNEVVRIAGLVVGPAQPEQWAIKSQSVDFYDLKADVSALLGLTYSDDRIEFVAAKHPALQPGQAANIVRNDEVIGVLGKLHPMLSKRSDIKRAVYLFELDANATLASNAPIANPISKYPAIRRDIAVIVDDKVLAQDLVRSAAAAAPELIRDVRIFDIYKGPGIEAGLKSVALGLILQETSRTLTDDDADSVMTAAIDKLQQEFAAELRD